MSMFYGGAWRSTPARGKEGGRAAPRCRKSRRQPATCRPSPKVLHRPRDWGNSIAPLTRHETLSGTFVIRRSLTDYPLARSSTARALRARMRLSTDPSGGCCYRSAGSRRGRRLCTAPSSTDCWRGLLTRRGRRLGALPRSAAAHPTACRRTPAPRPSHTCPAARRCISRPRPSVASHARSAPRGLGELSRLIRRPYARAGRAPSTQSWPGLRFIRQPPGEEGVENWPRRSYVSYALGLRRRENSLPDLRRRRSLRSPRLHRETNSPKLLEEQLRVPRTVSVSRRASLRPRSLSAPGTGC